MSPSSEVTSTELIAEREVRQQKRARLSPWILASRFVTHYRARLVPSIFALIILVPGAMMLVSGRDLSSAEASKFDVIGLSTLATMIGRVGTLAILALSLLAVLGWFASERRGQKRRSRSSSRRQQIRRPGAAALERQAQESGTSRTASALSSVDTTSIDESDTAAAIRRRMLSTAHAARVQGELENPKGAARKTSGRGASQRGRSRSARAGARSTPLGVIWLLVAVLVYHLTNSILPQLTGLADKVQLNSFYFCIVVLALYASRRMPRRKVLDAIQWSIAIYMLAGIALAVLHPAAATTSAGLEQRIGFVSSRFWGVGSNPNSVAPLAILQLILQLRQHWRSSPTWLVANLVAAAAAVVVIVWAQSQTAWAAAALIVPWVMVRSRFERRFDLTTIAPHHAVIGLICGLIAIGLLGAELISRNTVGAVVDALPGQEFWKGDSLTTATRVGDQFMTGRGIIWSIALDTWQDHPWLGFGSTAWDYDFRQAYGLPLATSAHNQWMQSLSMAGLVGAVPLLVYVVLLAWFSWRLSGPSRGLSLAVFALLMIRTVTEVPLESRIILSSDVVQQLTLLFVVFVYAAGKRLKARPRRTRRPISLN